MCTHEPQCPSAGDIARAAARAIAGHPEQGWSLLCNCIVLFDDGGLLLPDGRAAARVRGPVRPLVGGPGRVASSHVHPVGRRGRRGRLTGGQRGNPGQDLAVVRCLRA
jgi:hypothetical protein